MKTNHCSKLGSRPAPWLARVCLLIGLALSTNGGRAHAAVTIQVLGTGTEALLGGDLTDPENDGNEAAGPDHASWNWKTISSNHQPGFQGRALSYNVFDNKLGAGTEKWCCPEAREENPRNITVEFKESISLTHFTVSSANDLPDRDPLKWQIQGSNDGLIFEPIYVRDSGESLWPERLQVVKFTFDTPAKPYRFIRFECTQSAASLFQVGEIEYFGKISGPGGPSIPAVSKVIHTASTFVAQVTDGKDTRLDPASVKLNLDGQNVATTLSKTADVTTITCAPASPFLPLSAHTYELTAKDTQGNAVTESGRFTTANYTFLTSDLRVTNADTSKPGFVWNIFQNDGNKDTTNARAEDQLAGKTGGLPNLADPSAQGSAKAPGVAGPNGLITFEIESVINLDQGGGSNGAFRPDGQMPGIPGIEGSDDGIAAEALTFIELPKGMITMGVNSDDGFRVTAGRVRDALGTVFAGEFNGGRPTMDTLFPIYVEEAGVYEFRCIWQEGSSGASIEWFVLKADGTTKVLINDVANGGPKAYRARVPGPTPVLARKALPAPGQSGVAPDVDITVELVDPTGAAVDRSTVTMKLDGNSVTPKVDKAAGITTIVLASTSSLAPNSNHAVELTFKAGTATETRKWSFTVANYATLPVALGTVLGSGTASQPGFRIRTHQVDSSQVNADSRAENQLRGLLPDPNVADLSKAQGGFFTEPGVINFNQDAPDAAGNFTAADGNQDKPIYGIPGTSGSYDNLAQEVLTYVEFPKAGT